MTIKHILVYVDNDKACAQRLDLALALAARHEARLTGVYVRRQFIVPAYAGVHIPTEVLDENERISDELTQAAEKAFREHLRERGGEAQWRAVEGRLPHAFSQWARCADLMLLGQYDAEDEGMNDNYRPDSLLLAGGAPVLLTPSTGAAGLPHAHAIVAWDGGREAARAVRDALPLLHHMEKVTVYNVDDGHGEPVDLDQICDHLSRHGMQVERRQAPPGDLGAGDLLLDLAAESGADLVVMGAYGHSRLRETVLGGVTRYVLQNMPVPVLMSH